MPDTKPRRWLTKPISQMRTLWRAISRGREEDQLKVVYGVIRRLPLRESTRHKLLQKPVSWVLAKHVKSSGARIQEAQSVWDANGKLRLEQLLAGNEAFDIPTPEVPLMSFIVVVKDKAHLTVLTLESFCSSQKCRMNSVWSTMAPPTSVMLERFKGARIIHNQDNLGFGPACMQAAAVADGRYLCFLNNDALITPGAVSAVLKNFEQDRVGAVGAKILLANGAEVRTEEVRVR